MDLGTVIRELRLTHGWSQGRLAAKLREVSQHATITREDVSRWERGKRTPGAFWLRHLATVLEVPLTALEADPVKRRTFLTDVAALSIAPAAASDLIEHGFAAALSKRPTLDHWHEKLAAYGSDYMALGAAEIQRRLASDLVVLQQQLDTSGMWGVAAKLMTLYGKTFPGADGSKAVNWYMMATHAADRSDDDTARVWVRGRAAIALGYEGASLSVAESLANQALAISEKPSLGRLNALVGKAHIAAIRGDAKGALTLLEEGRRVFDVSGSEEQESDYAVPLWRMNVFTSLLAARLGDERTALTAQEVATQNLPPSLPRFATHLEMHRGLMMVRSGDRPGGISYARAALNELPAEKHSLTLRMLMAEIENC
ncbi:helix-turn-helix domain-containing protein [Sphaerimonospora cavernae]|uniref:Helix-turn-helix domain-containing protein n=1 Tax=Sphaerimonospora cavernae TaxID=1740611 RepID=A0ABV6TZN2_9ACTN